MLNFHIANLAGTVLEKCATLDFAMGRAKKLSKSSESRLLILDMSEKGKVVRASAKQGSVMWHVPCKKCQAGKWCDACSGTGSLVTDDAWIG